MVSGDIGEGKDDDSDPLELAKMAKDLYVGLNWCRPSKRWVGLGKSGDLPAVRLQLRSKIFSWSRLRLMHIIRERGSTGDGSEEPILTVVGDQALVNGRHRRKVLERLQDKGGGQLARSRLKLNF